MVVTHCSSLPVAAVSPFATCCSTVCNLLFDHGAVMTTSDRRHGWTALHWSALKGHLQVGLLLCSKGADLVAMAVNGRGENSLMIYGNGGDLSRETLQEYKAALLDCFRKGPYPSQVQRRKDENWARRLPFMLVMTGCELQALARATARPPFAEPASAARREDPAHRNRDRSSEARAPEHGRVWAGWPVAPHRELAVTVESSPLLRVSLSYFSLARAAQ